MAQSSYLLLSLGIVLFTAFLGKVFIADKYRFPAVTLYVLLGALTGISALNIFTEHSLEILEFVSRLGVGLIAFIIGSELDGRTLRKLGASIIIIALFESVFAFLLVAGAMVIMLPGKPAYALVLGAVASATAPAATVYVIRQFKSKGPLTSTVLGVVGIDDAVALIIFVFSSLYAENILSGREIHLLQMIGGPLLTIAESVGIGIIVGLLCYWLLRKIRDPDSLLMAAFAVVLILLDLSRFLGLSELLTIMSFAVFLTNTDLMLSHRTKAAMEKLSPILLPAFFILAGAHLDFRLFSRIGVIGVVYTLMRASGKITGGTIGAIIGRASPVVRKYVGFSLIPQVGVAIALALAVKTKFGSGQFGAAGSEMADVVINILLFTTLITEVIGPILTRATLTAAGETQKGA